MWLKEQTLGGDGGSWGPLGLLGDSGCLVEFISGRSNVTLYIFPGLGYETEMVIAVLRVKLTWLFIEDHKRNKHQVSVTDIPNFSLTSWISNQLLLLSW